MVATMPVDFRNYSKPLIVLSLQRRLPRRQGFRATSLHIILARRMSFSIARSLSGVRKRPHLSVGGITEASSSSFSNVLGRLKRMHRTGVVQNMCCGVLFGDRRLLARRLRNVLGEDVLEARARHRVAGGV